MLKDKSFDYDSDALVTRFWNNNRDNIYVFFNIPFSQEPVREIEHHSRQEYVNVVFHEIEQICHYFNLVHETSCDIDIENHCQVKCPIINCKNQ